ncbi:MAG TPA: double-strand break repair protein AddB [Devosiaceae bacterium]|jgi:ATP-dependent helicase/nuclease subunit B
MSRPPLYTIAPDASFLETLAARIIDGTLIGDWPRTGPFWLSDITIVLPTRRARLALAEAFRAKGHGLLPDIRTFGGEAPDEEPFLPPLDAEPLPPAVSRLERRLVLARLIAAWSRTPAGATALSTPPHMAEILALADSLGEVIDDLNTEQVPVEALRTLPPEDLAANWQQTLAFLNLALEVWPQILAERHKGEATALRNERLRRRAEAAPLLYGDRPVIAAGSTGSIPATAALLAAIARLPRGAVVLPGLDTSLGPDGHQALLRADNAPHGHPQYGLMQLLRRLGAAITDVKEIGTPTRPDRVAMVRRALALADATAHWVDDRAALGKGLRAATDGLGMLAAHTADEEARAIAVAARDGLERGQRVGIVSPDRNLARRIAAELARFGVFVDDAAGAPLFQAPAGRLARQILSVATGEFSAVDLMALLRNRAATLGLGRNRVTGVADAIELGLLRGQRPGTGLLGLRQALADNVGEITSHPARRLTAVQGEAVETLFAALDDAITPICTLLRRERFTAPEFALALADAMILVLTPGPDESPDALPGRREFEGWIEEIAARQGDGPNLPVTGLDQVLYKLMAGFDVRNVQPRRDDIAIWGQLEARLQNPDLMILAGLNEDIWPATADPGPWLSRGMRLKAGLEPPERRQGLMAHDFEMALGNAHVIIAFAERLGTSPALPSRLVQRLEAFMGAEPAAALRAKGRVWIEAARALDRVPETRAASRPAPRPKASERPRRLSVTEIETLFRSPYDIYARHVLRLRPLDPLATEPGARERGSMIHDVFARFVLEGHDFAAADALAVLNRLAAESFAGLDGIGERRDIWLKRFEVAAAAFLTFERGRDAQVARRHAEIDGDWLFPTLDGFRLTGRADRLDRLIDGTLEIIDFKTGGVPQKKAMVAFDAPQLLLEAAMARAGAFAAMAPAEASALTYIKIGLGPDAFQPSPFRPRDDFSLMEAAEEASRRMQRHVIEFLLSDIHPMHARIRPDTMARFAGAYDHLARTDEWTLVEGDDSE